MIVIEERKKKKKEKNENAQLALCRRRIAKLSPRCILCRAIDLQS